MGVKAVDEREQRLRQNILLNNLNGIFASLMSGAVGPFLGVFAIALKATDVQIALISSLPALVSLLVMIPGAWYVDKVKNKKAVTGGFIILSRVFYLAMVFIPFLPAGAQPGVLVALVALMNLPGALANVSWQSVVASLIPLEHRGRAFAQRNRQMAVVGLVATLVGGLVMDRVLFPGGYQIMFATAFVLGVFETYFFLQMRVGPESASASDRDSASKQAVGFRQVLGNRVFVAFSLSSVVFHFGWQMGWPLFTMVQVQDLGATAMWVSLISVASTAGSFLAYRPWARLADRKGHTFALIFVTMGMATNSLFHAIARSLPELLAYNVLIGAATAGANLILFNAMLEATPESGRTTYIAYYTTLINLSATLAPYAGVYIAELLGLRPSLWVTTGMRLLGTLAFVRLYLRQRASRSAVPAVRGLDA
jgi:MFS family permease